MSVSEAEEKYKKMGGKYKCYFAHPSHTKNTKEEVEIIEELKARRIEVYNPFDTQLHTNTKEWKKKLSYKQARKIWIKDFKAVSDSDMILAYQPVGTAGTGAEILWAYINHKFIQIISPIRHPLFAYVLTGPNQMFETIEDWKKYIKLVWD